MNEGNPPPQYTYRPSRPSSGGVWKGIAIACLVLFAFVMLAFVGCGILFFKMVKSPEFKQYVEQSIQDTRDMEKCRLNLKDLGEALKRYREHNGRYPDSLKQLQPKYLPPGVSLHCPADRNPKTISYSYTKPSDQTPDDATIVECTHHRLGPLRLLKNGQVPEIFEAPRRPALPKSQP